MPCGSCLPFFCTRLVALLWRHNGRDGVSNHQPHDCLLNRSFRRRTTKTSKLRVTGLCAGHSPVTGEFPAQRPVTRKMFPVDDVMMGKKLQGMIVVSHPMKYGTCAVFKNLFCLTVIHAAFLLEKIYRWSIQLQIPFQGDRSICSNEYFMDCCFETATYVTKFRQI